MKFLCDVHISYKVTNHLISLGYDSIHVNSILNKWYTTDKEICAYADKYDFVVLTKDSDFKNSYIINKTPKKLVRISLGNISNKELMETLTSNITTIENICNHAAAFYIEVNQNGVISTILKPGKS